MGRPNTFEKCWMIELKRFIRARTWTYGYFPTEPNDWQRNYQLAGCNCRGFGPFTAHPERHDAGYREAMKVAQLLAQLARACRLADEMSKARMAVSLRVDESRDGMM